MKKAFQIAIFPVAIVAAVMWNHGKPAPETPASPTETSQASAATSPLRNPAANSSASQAPLTSSQRAPSSTTAPEKLAALDDMAHTLFQFTQPDVPLKDLVQYLESSRQQPLVTRNSNAATGEMAIIRTESPLPGTRYFHAQYFADENNQSFVQHMSFEFQPSESAMNDAIAAVQRSFPNLSAPERQQSDFVQWNLKNGYIVWVKKMAAADLQDNPFNAYTKADIGTVRVAVEMNIDE
jgi:hypothetical protein